MNGDRYAREQLLQESKELSQFLPLPFVLVELVRSYTPAKFEGRLVKMMPTRLKAWRNLLFCADLLMSPTLDEVLSFWDWRVLSSPPSEEHTEASKLIPCGEVRFTPVEGARSPTYIGSICQVDGSIIAVSLGDDTIRFVDTRAPDLKHAEVGMVRRPPTLRNLHLLGSCVDGRSMVTAGTFMSLQQRQRFGIQVWRRVGEVWHGDNVQVVREIFNPRFKTTVKVLSCGLIAATTLDRQVLLYDPDSGAITQELKADTNHDNDIVEVGSDRLATLSRRAEYGRSQIIIWNIKSGACLRTIDLQSEVTHFGKLELTYLCDDWLAGLCDGIEVWNVATGRQVYDRWSGRVSLKKGMKRVYSMLWLPNRRLLLFGLDKKSESCIKVLR